VIRVDGTSLARSVHDNDFSARTRGSRTSV
jgi:hypothetical protein